MLVFRNKQEFQFEGWCKLQTTITIDDNARFEKAFGTKNKSQSVRSIILKAILEKEKEVFNLQQKETDAKINF